MDTDTGGRSYRHTSPPLQGTHGGNVFASWDGLTPMGLHAGQCVVSCVRCCSLHHSSPARVISGPSPLEGESDVDGSAAFVD